MVPSLAGAQDGAACCIVAPEDFVHARKLENQAIEIVAQARDRSSSRIRIRERYGAGRVWDDKAMRRQSL